MSKSTQQGRKPRRKTGITYRGQKTTHDTDGLPGFPAVDIFAPAGTAFLAPENGRVVRLSGRGGTSGNVFGYSIYFVGASGRVYFITHLNYKRAGIGSYKAGAVLGTVSAWSGGSTHAHVGINDSGYNPGTGDTSGSAPSRGSSGGASQAPQTPNTPDMGMPEGTGALPLPGGPPPNAPPMPELPGQSPGLPTDDISEQWRRLAQQPLVSPETLKWAGLG